jgi:aryl-phospho-beta-D-glucosidase BglC (GH1 family)
MLNQANKLVYSPHDYPNSVWPQQWFQVNEFPENLTDVFREAWGFIFEEGIAPIYLGEFGSELVESKDIAWMDEITQYLNGDFNTDGVVDIPATQEGMSFAYWSWNPNSSFTGGILMDDWSTVHQHKLAAIEPLLFG